MQIIRAVQCACVCHNPQSTRHLPHASSLDNVNCSWRRLMKKSHTRIYFAINLTNVQSLHGSEMASER